MRKSSTEWDKDPNNGSTPSEASIEVGKGLSSMGSSLDKMFWGTIGVVGVLMMGEFWGIGLVASLCIYLVGKSTCDFFGHRLRTGHWIPPELAEQLQTQFQGA